MKLLLTMILCVSAFAVQATEIEIYSERYNPDRYHFKPLYRVNSTQGEAWFGMNIEERMGPFGRYDDVFTYYKHLEVPGMYFDMQTEEIMFEDTVCATTYVKRSRIGRKIRVIKPTGNCILEDRIERNSTREYKVYLIIK